MRLFFPLSLVLTLSFKTTNAALDVNMVAGYVYQNPQIIMNLRQLSSPSGVLTSLLHWIFGNRMEIRFKNLLERSRKVMADTATIDDVNEDNSEKMTFRNGKIIGLKSIQMVPNSQVSVIWTRAGVPVATIEVEFKDLRYTGVIKTSMVNFKTIDGTADVKVLDGNKFILKFHIYPGLMSRCWLKLYDVETKYMESLQWTITRKDNGKVDNIANMAMQGYFASTNGELEDHIKSTLENAIYQQVPMASRGMCYNKRRLRKSKYERMDKSKKIDTDRALRNMNSFKLG